MNFINQMSFSILLVGLSASVFSGCLSVKKDVIPADTTSQNISNNNIFKTLVPAKSDGPWFLRAPEHYEIKTSLQDKDVTILIFPRESLKDVLDVVSIESEIKSGELIEVAVYPGFNAAPAYVSEKQIGNSQSIHFSRFIAYFSQEESDPDLYDFTYVMQGFSGEDYFSLRINRMQMASGSDGFVSKSNLSSLDDSLITLVKSILN